MESIDKKEKLNYLKSYKQIVALKYLKDDELKQFIKVTDIISYGKKEIIIKEGEYSPYIFGVLSGSVAVTVSEIEKEKKDDDVYICTIGKGDIFGEAGIFMNVKRTANVISTDKTTIFSIHRKEFLQFIKEHPGIGIKILMLVIFSLLRKLKEANHELAFERKADIDQNDVDGLVDKIMKQV
jgi:CRP/FNR family transcriptional regulator, cyclic AMP receptor protein